MSSRCDFQINLHERRKEAVDWRNQEFPGAFNELTPSKIEAYDELANTEEAVWRCPRTASKSGKCVLHSPTSDNSEVSNAIKNALRGEIADGEGLYNSAGIDQETAALQFLGVTIEKLDLSGWQEAAPGSAPVDLRFTEITELQLEEASFDRSVRIDGATIETVNSSEIDLDGSFRARYAELTHGLSMKDASVAGPVDCRFSAFSGDISLQYTIADGRFDFGFAKSGGSINATKGGCGGRFTLKETDFTRVVADGIDVSGPDPESDIPGLQFRGLTTEAEVTITEAECDGQLIGYKMDIGGNFDASNARITEGVSLGTESGTKLREADIKGSLIFSAADIDGDFKIIGRAGRKTNPKVGGAVDFSDATFERLTAAPQLTHEKISVVDCRNTTIASGKLSQPTTASPIVYDLEEAEIGSIDLEFEEEFAPDCVWLNRTEFNGFKFVGKERTDFDGADWDLTTSSPEKRQEIAFSRVFVDATEYAIDFATICNAQPSTRDWFLSTDPPYDVEAIAERVFDTVDSKTVDTVAKNGPENEEQMGESLFQRERYRVGLVTHLGRHLSSSQSKDRFEELQSATTILSGHGDLLRQVATHLANEDDTQSTDGTTLDGHFDRNLQAVSSELSDAIADALATEIQQADKEQISRSLEQQELTYINARKGADDVGDSSTAGHLFVNECRVRRRIHQRENDSRKRVSNLVFDYTAGFGERPKRAFLSSGAIIGLFSVAYWGLWRLYQPFSSSTYAGVDGAILLSSASFTAFVLGGAEVTPKAIRLLANFEALIGAFMIALFMFTLTRSLHR